MIKLWIHEQSNNITGIFPFPVMLNEVIKITLPSPKKFIDCTFGGGGYSKEILKFSETYVKAIDRDKNALSIAKK